MSFMFREYRVLGCWGLKEGGLCFGGLKMEMVVWEL